MLFLKCNCYYFILFYGKAVAKLIHKVRNTENYLSVVQLEFYFIYCFFITFRLMFIQVNHRFLSNTCLHHKSCTIYTQCYNKSLIGLPEVDLAVTYNTITPSLQNITKNTRTVSLSCLYILSVILMKCL